MSETAESPDMRRIAVGQMTSVGDQEANFQACSAMAREARGKGCQMVSDRGHPGDPSTITATHSSCPEAPNPRTREAASPAPPAPLAAAVPPRGLQLHWGVPGGEPLEGGAP